MCMSSLRSVAALAASLACTSIPAQADNIKFSFNQNGPFWFGNLRQDIGLNNSNAKVLQFSNPSSGLVAIFFNAECQLIGRPQSIVNVDILIDGTIVPVTNGDDAFCAGRGVGVEGGWARHSLTVARTLSAGTHSLRVKATALGVHTGARLDNITVLVAR